MSIPMVARFTIWYVQYMIVCHKKIYNDLLMRMFASRFPNKDDAHTNGAAIPCLRSHIDLGRDFCLRCVMTYDSFNDHNGLVGVLPSSSPCCVLSNKEGEEAPTV